ncbi:MAG TPA: bifunctional phosphoglucose/phosphomannose isomerase [Candidatus Nanoarchaeia archaeon]|nr:bifunctional phosphoglucose/phosphomannose isomerase [Candidatus Nanoarchaeia archaeon]
MEIDKSNMLKAIEDFPYQCKNAIAIARNSQVSGKFNKIVILGMGGSAVGGDILKILMHNSKIPVFTVRDYKIPEFVDQNTLVFAVSYSGNTEETLSAYEGAVKKKAKIVAITSGGILSEKAKQIIRIPKGLQPRAALGYVFFPVLKTLANSGIAELKESDINEMSKILLAKNQFKSFGKSTAKKIGDKTTIIYASDLFGPVAYRWKTQINENGKSAAYTHLFSEMNHNEIVGYETMKRNDFFAVIIKDKSYHTQVNKRIKLTSQTIKSKIGMEEVETKGNSLLARVFSGVYYGDFVSYYIAINKKIDPTPVDVIEKLKKRLK